MLEEKMLQLQLVECQGVHREESSARDLIRDAVVLILLGGERRKMNAKKAQQIATHFEKILYLGASTFSEYSNLKTLKLRLKKVATEAQEHLSLRNATTKPKKVFETIQEFKAEPFNPVFSCRSFTPPDFDLRIFSPTLRSVYHVDQLN
jgi:hypothetical protein